MSDLISRQAVKEQACMFFGHEVIFANKIDLIPSADRPTGWIPVSERLPENNGCMLVTIDDAIEFGKYEDGEWSIWVCEHWDEWDAKGVIAWMPIPEPYKEDSDG